MTNTLYSRGNPYTVVTQSGTYSAKTDEFVISDGSDVTLPSAKQDEVVVVRGAVGSETTVLPQNNETVQLQSKGVKLLNAEDAVFVSNGDNWYIRNEVYFVGLNAPESGVARFEYEGDLTDSWGSNGATKTTNVSFTSNSEIGLQALDFPGSNSEYVTISNFGDVLTSPPLSVSMWIQADNPGDDDGLFAIGPLNDNGNGFNLGILNNDVTVLVGGSANNKIGSWATNEYLHLVVTYDGVTIKSYKNGAPLGSASESKTLDFTGNNGYLGVYYGSSFTFDGRQDDPRIYDKVLTDTEVQRLYNYGSI